MSILSPTLNKFLEMACVLGICDAYSCVVCSEIVYVCVCSFVRPGFLFVRVYSDSQGSLFSTHLPKAYLETGKGRERFGFGFFRFRVTLQGVFWMELA